MSIIALSFFTVTTVLAVVSLSQGSTQCVPSLISEGRRGPRPMMLTGNIVIPAYNFTCSGVVLRWEAKASGRGSIHFQVWRWTPEIRSRLVGENIAVIGGGASQGDTVHLAVTEPSEQIFVLPGDFIGIFVGKHGKIQSVMSTVIESHISDSEEPLHGFVRPLNVNPAFESHLKTAPLIGVTVEAVEPTTPGDIAAASTPTQVISTNIPVPTQTPDTSGNTSTEDPLPYSLIAAVSIFGAVLLAICVGIGITIICFILKNKRLRTAQDHPTAAPDGQSKMSTLLHSLDAPRRNLFNAFRRQGSVQGTLQEETRNARPVVGVDLRSRNPNLSQSTLELPYAYPMTERSIPLVRSTSATLPRKPGSHANIPLPEIPKEIELRENPSYSALNSLESLNQPDTGENVTENTGENVYDVPVFRRDQKPSIPIEYEIPVSSLNSSGGLAAECSHMYESTDDMYETFVD